MRRSELYGMTELFSRQLFRNLVELQRSHDETFFRLACRVISRCEGDSESINKFIDRIQRGEITHSEVVHEIQQFLACDVQAPTSIAPIELNTVSRDFNQHPVDITRSIESYRHGRMKPSSSSIRLKNLSSSITPLEKIGRLLSRGDK